MTWGVFFIQINFFEEHHSFIILRFAVSFIAEVCLEDMFVNDVIVSGPNGRQGKYTVQALELASILFSN